ncbi:MAG TPA: 1-deoxy-D-xylulose-5-phosphate reductoisomerase [Candidatus Binatia bacterium]|nr:1-deoxy-D-xylulose-5-phosphate reductoisomerase [Candidatus Binatia bacterium]
MKQLAVLGSTGSIGVTTLSIVERFPDRFRVVALAAGKNLEKLKEQVRLFQPELVSITSEADAKDLRAYLPGFRGEILWGARGLLAVATHPGADLVMAALVGAAGLPPTLAAIQTGKTIALANKEALVIAGELMTREAKQHGVRLLPVDSEHNAIFQALQGHSRERVKRIILTASGGPFLRRPIEELATVSVAEALQHPTWKMGNKITIDSATLMNKGLEVIEARWLFDLPPEQVAVIIHPQSVVHSMVEYVDGSVLAQLGIPDMAIPISYILAYPDRLSLTHLPALDLAAAAQLTFFQPDFVKFSCLGLAYEALGRGGTCPAVLNAVNEVAVASFLSGQIRFPDIAALNRRVLDAHTTQPVNNLGDLLEADRWARSHAREALSLPQPRAVALV